jgi:hypothetical protein
VGSPFGPKVSISNDDSEGTAAELSGHSIIEAQNLDAAKAISASKFSSGCQHHFRVHRTHSA